MQTNGRFIQEIQDVNQSCADLAGKTNTLGFATRQRVSAAV
jgi:hypothetical protein